MSDWLTRERMLIGDAAVEKLSNSAVAVLGLGGVGGAACEALVRAGIGTLIIVDFDKISESNFNRQIIADNNTIGKPKTEVMKERILHINPKAKVFDLNTFFSEETSDAVFSLKPDYIIDAMDTVKAKLHLILTAKQKGVPIISSMGTGNKLHPELFKISDISKTSVCPLAKVMRTELRKLRLEKGLKVLYSTEIPLKPFFEEQNENSRQIPGSISFVPPCAGFMLAGEAIRELIAEK